ncbi:MAG: carboxylate--amine ligase [Patescibacteria group bacterium]|nr:carboxylate--amine ligase [Patescibacteria group bacterium]
MKRILVLGAGGAPSTNFVHALKKKRKKYYLVGTDANPYYLARAETDTAYLVPKANDPAFLPAIRTIIKNESIDIIHIQNDKEVVYISEHRNEIPTILFLPSQETVRICQDKYESYLRWKEHGIRVPETIPINTPDDVSQAFKHFGNYVWLRCATGAAGNGSLKARNETQAIAWITFHNGWGKFTAARVLEPESVTWMSIWYHGELIVAQGRKRLYWEASHLSPSGVTGITGAGVTIDDPVVDDIALKAIQAIDTKPHGLFGVDLTYDHEGIPNPTEINIGRFFTTHLFFTELGLNMPDIAMSLAVGEKPKLPKKRINPLEPGWVWIRGVDFEPILIREEEILDEPLSMVAKSKLNRKPRQLHELH